MNGWEESCVQEVSTNRLHVKVHKRRGQGGRPGNNKMEFGTIDLCVLRLPINSFSGDVARELG